MELYTPVLALLVLSSGFAFPLPQKAAGQFELFPARPVDNRTVDQLTAPRRRSA